LNDYFPRFIKSSYQELCRTVEIDRLIQEVALTENMAEEAVGTERTAVVLAVVILTEIVAVMVALVVEIAAVDRNKVLH
jgi:hypothetical protein